MKLVQDKIWAGTEESLQAALKAEEDIATKRSAGSYDEDEDEDVPYLLERHGNVGVISIKGPLTNRDSYWNRYFGISSYPAIREALVAAAADSALTQVVLDIDSGGGAVNGVEDTANLIRMINDKIKPVTAFTDGTMASAAYWLGCSAGEVFCGRTSLVGSIGVISTHMEYSKQLKDEGVGVTVVRAGKYKALLNSVEEPTKEAIAGLQSLLDATYNVFVEHVANMRGRTVQQADETMAQGREFVGEQAVGAHLVDGITTFDKLLSSLEEKPIDTSGKFIDNFQNSFQGAPMKKALTEQQIAAMAAGQPSTAVEANPAATAVTEPTEQTSEAVAAGAAAEQTAEAVAAGAAAQADTAEPEDGKLVAFLQGELHAAQDALIASKVQVAKLEAQHAEFSSAVTGLMEIAAQSINNMRIALGGSAAALAEMTPTALLAEHKRMSGEFKAKFPVGGVATVDAAAEAADKPTEIDPLHKLRLAAVRSTVKAN